MENGRNEMFTLRVLGSSSLLVEREDVDEPLPSLLMTRGEGLGMSSAKYKQPDNQHQITLLHTFLGTINCWKTKYNCSIIEHW